MKYLLWGLSMLATGLGAYLAGYLKKKGEARAIDESFKKVLDQTAEMSRTTKKIETEISQEIWNRQKKFELKRDVLLEATKRIAEIDDALLSFDSTLRTDDPSWNEAKHERLLRWSKASTAFDESRLFVGVACDQATRESVENFGKLVNDIAAGITKKDSNSYPAARKDLAIGIFKARNAIRKELGFEPLTPQPALDK